MVDTLCSRFILDEYLTLESSKGVFCVIDKAVRADVACVQFSHIEWSKSLLLMGDYLIFCMNECLSSPRLSSQKKPYFEHQGIILVSLEAFWAKI